MTELDRYDWLSFRGGDPLAFGRIYNRNKDRLLTYCVHLGLTRESGEDVLQVAFTQLARERGEIESIRNWLFVCARNLCLNQLKRLRRETDQPYAATVSSEIDPGMAEFIDRVLKRLLPEERELILLRELHGFSARELAAMQNTSEQAIRVRLYRIRKRMHELGKVLI